MADFRGHAAWIWTQITEGLPANPVKDELLEITSRYGAPQFLTDIQLDGITYFLRRRDQVLEGAAEVHDKWWAYELYAQAILRGDPPPLSDGVGTALHGNAKHIQRKQVIVSRCRELDSSEEYSSKQAVARAYSEEYYEEFGEEISPRTILRYWKEVDRRV